LNPHPNTPPGGPLVRATDRARRIHAPDEASGVNQRDAFAACPESWRPLQIQIGDEARMLERRRIGARGAAMSPIPAIRPQWAGDALRPRALIRPLERGRLPWRGWPMSAYPGNSGRLADFLEIPGSAIS
jgi:hypothetical protein